MTYPPSTGASLERLIRYFLDLGATGFGGPVALVQKMRRDLVKKKGWISEAEFREGVALAQLTPGPLAAQLAMYIGRLRGGMKGATGAALAFVLPSLIIILVIAEAYKRVSGIPEIEKLFYGVGAAVIGVIARSSYKLARSLAERDLTLWLIIAINAAATIYFQREIVWLLLVSGLVAFPSQRGTVTASVLLPIFTFFLMAGLVVFGSGLAIIPYLHGGVVVERHWLTDRQFLDALAVSLLTPGPVVITVAFIGSLVGGLLGGVVAAFAVFLPAYILVLFVAPHIRKFEPFIRGVTAAAIGALIGAVVIMARRNLTDEFAMAIAAVALLLRFRKTPEPLVILAGGVAGFFR